MIQVKNITYQIGKKELVKELSFDVKSGELLAILGANGAGKSTLMKLLCREISPNYGDIMLGGQYLKKYSLPELARRRAVLSQQNTISISFIVNEQIGRAHV